MDETEEKKITTEEEALPENIDKKTEDIDSRSVSFEGMKKKLEEYETEIKDLKDKYLRALADQDNFRKRVEREKAELFNYGLTNFIKELLPIVDNLESALIEAQKSGNDSTAMVEGIKLILSKFNATLKKHGVQEIEALNKPFDPSLHEAIARAERNDVAPMTVVAEMERGYLLKGRILRPSKVVVAVESQKKQDGGNSEVKENSEGGVENG